MELVRFFAGVVKIALLLAVVGCLKSCTLELLGLSAEKSATGMTSFTKYTRALSKRQEP